MNEQPKQPSQKKLYRYAFSKITVILLSAMLFSGLLISVANDTYAFVKKDEQIVMTLSEGMSLSEIARQMERSGVIANPTVFTMYVRSKHKASAVESFSGDVTLNSAMSYREILAILSTPQTK